VTRHSDSPAVPGMPDMPQEERSVLLYHFFFEKSTAQSKYFGKTRQKPG